MKIDVQFFLELLAFISQTGYVSDDKTVMGVQEALGQEGELYLL
jgi:hypothetical protein